MMPIRRSPSVLADAPANTQGDFDAVLSILYVDELPGSQLPVLRILHEVLRTMPKYRLAPAWL